MKHIWSDSSPFSRISTLKTVKTVSIKKFEKKKPSQRQRLLSVEVAIPTRVNEKWLEELTDRLLSLFCLDDLCWQSAKCNDDGATTMEILHPFFYSLFVINEGQFILISSRLIIIMTMGWRTIENGMEEVMFFFLKSFYRGFLIFWNEWFGSVIDEILIVLNSRFSHVFLFARWDKWVGHLAVENTVIISGLKFLFSLKKGIFTNRILRLLLINFPSFVLFFIFFYSFIFFNQIPWMGMEFFKYDVLISLFLL